MDLGVLGRLVRRRYSGKIRDLSCSGFLVQPLRVALFCYLDRNIDEDFDERDGVIFAVAASRMEFTGNLSIRSIWRNEGCESNR
jgi:hypothetical protein